MVYRDLVNLADYRCSKCGKEYNWYDGSIKKDNRTKARVCGNCGSPLIYIKTGEIIDAERLSRSEIELYEDEKIIRKLKDGFLAMLHFEKVEALNVMTPLGLRKSGNLILTDSRLILEKDGSIHDEIPLTEIKNVEMDIYGVGNKCLKIDDLNGKNHWITFHTINPKKILLRGVLILREEGNLCTNWLIDIRSQLKK